MEPRLRPRDFATALCNQLPFFKSEEDKKSAIEKMTNSILDQIQAHIDKNTFFPRVRFCRKDEEIISNDQVCVSCDSILTNPDICIHCGFQYERKPGPQAAQGQSLPLTTQVGQSTNNQGSNLDNNIVKKSSSSIIIHQQSSIIQNQSSNQSYTAQISLNLDSNNEFQVPQNRIPQGQMNNEKQNEIRTDQIGSWRERIGTDYSFSGKEKKICKKCGDINPFFKNECKVCNYKFPKTRGLNSSLNSDNYTLYFWDMLHSDPLFSSLNKLNDYLEETDFISVRDLYKKVKEVLSQPNTERLFDITDTQLLELHDSIDEKFEWLLTDNELTDRIFNDATAQKTNRKRQKQVYYNFKDAQDIYERKMNGTEAEQVINNEDSMENTSKRRKIMTEAGVRFKNRPHNFESVKMQTIIHNYNVLSQMGFLDQRVLQSENINKLINEKDASVSLIKKRGRPKKFDLTYEDMLKELKKRKEMMEAKGLIKETIKKDMQMGMLMYAEFATILENQFAVMTVLLLFMLIAQDMIKYLQFFKLQQQCPRGKWKCYFCKVTKYGLKQVPRMAPNERPICDQLADNSSTWEEKALMMLDILREYQCMRTFYEEVSLTLDQKDTLKKKKQIDINEESKSAELPNLQDLYEKIQINEDTKEFGNHDAFCEQLKNILNVYVKGLEKKDVIHLQAKACINLIDKLIVENEIFTYIKPIKKKLQFINSQFKGSQKENLKKGGKQNDKSLSIDHDQDRDSEENEDEQNSVEESSEFEVNIDNDVDAQQTPIKTRTQAKPNFQQDNKTNPSPKKQQNNLSIPQSMGTSTPGRITRNRLKSMNSNH